MPSPNAKRQPVPWMLLQPYRLPRKPQHLGKQAAQQPVAPLTQHKTVGDVMERRDTNRPPSSRRITTKSGFLLDTFLVIIILFFFSSPSCNEGDLPSQIFSFASRRSHCVSFHNTRLNFPIFFLNAAPETTK